MWMKGNDDQDKRDIDVMRQMRVKKKAVTKGKDKNKGSSDAGASPDGEESSEDSKHNK